VRNEHTHRGWSLSGSAAALASALLFGVTTPVAKQLLTDSNPLLIAGLLYAGSGLGLTAMMLVQDRGHFTLGLADRDRPWLMGAIVAGGVLAPALLMFGLGHADAAAASLLLNLEAVFTAVFAWIVFREATTRRVMLGFAAIFAGSLSLVWPSSLASAICPPPNVVHDGRHQVTIKKLLVVAVAVIGTAAAAVLLFYAGDHDDEYRRPGSPTGGRPSSREPTSTITVGTLAAALSVSKAPSRGRTFTRTQSTAKRLGANSLRAPGPRQHGPAAPTY